MGKLVVFWSPYKGHAKVTSSLCAVAGAFGMQYPEINVAISHVNSNSMELEKRLDCSICPEERRKFYGKTGVAALVLNYMQEVLTAEKIKRCAVQLEMRSLFLYPYLGKAIDELVFYLMSDQLKREYEVVFLDLGGGETSDSKKFIEAADLVVVVLPQSRSFIEQFKAGLPNCLEKKTFSILFGGYLEKSRYSLTYYARKKGYPLHGNLVGAIPLNTGFFDAMETGKTLEFFLKNQRVTKQEENYGFIIQAKKAAEYIRKNIYLS